MQKKTPAWLIQKTDRQRQLIITETSSRQFPDFCNSSYLTSVFIIFLVRKWSHLLVNDVSHSNSVIYYRNQIFQFPYMAVVSIVISGEQQSMT